jgi:hypothetical protein
MIGTGDENDPDMGLGFGRFMVALMVGTALVIALVACTTEPGGSVAFSNGSGVVQVGYTEVAPQVEVYRDVERCAGLTGNPHTAEWRRLDEPVRFPDGHVWYGAYETEVREIYFTDSLSLRHEILHDLVWLNTGDLGHPSPPFGVCDR